MSNSTISGNSALSGGGISNSGILNITNITVSGNRASGGDGGGISNSGILNLNSTTITNNTAEDLYNWGGGTGGGVSGGGTVIVANTIIAGNFNNRNLYGGDINPDVSGDFTDDGNNLIGDNTGSADFTTSSILGSSANPIDPKLSPLQNNGGATLTHALLEDSRAINAGNNALIPAGITTDQRSIGFDRVSEGTVDIGALEFNGLIGTSGADNLVGNNYADIIDAEAGNDIITGNQDNDLLTGGGGKDKFVYNLGDGVDTISDFGELGKGSNPSAAIVGELDTLKFQGTGLTARNLLLTQNNNNLEITFKGVADDKVILQNLDNLSSIGNILFDGQSSIRDSFDVFNANSTQSTIFNKNTVTFVNDQNNNVNGFDNSDDVINGQGGDDRIDGKSGNDLLRGGAGNDTLIGGTGDDTLVSGRGQDSLIGGAGNDILFVGDSYDTLTGGSGNDQFVYQGFGSYSTITDFNQSQDKLVLTDLLKSRGYSGSNPILDGHLKFVQSGTSTKVNYIGVYDDDTVATLNNFTATNLVVGSNVLV
ncbi:calcium-binding protein [Nostoc sp.]|uniref:calcium-binding protein n=1 Tax=Nostoc sp. TaxID=1180 RepID=UPI002FF62FB2